MLIDTHTHVNLPQFKDDADQVIGRCLDADIWMVNIGTNIEDSKDAIALAHKYDKGVYASVGSHPNEVCSDFGILENLATSKKVVGIGETGLDYFRIKDEELVVRKKQQQELFIKHIELSKKVSKPLIIHCRDAHDDLMSILNSYRSQFNTSFGIMHFFTGTKEQARKYLDLGFYISFSGVITFAKEYEDVVRYVPKDRMLIETDAPFVAPAPQKGIDGQYLPKRGRRNEPFFVQHVAQKVADIRGVSFDEVTEQTTKNAREVFGM